MVRLLIRLRTAVFRHQLERASPGALWVLLLLGLLSGCGTLALGIVAGASVDDSLDRVSAVLALWFGGQLVQSALNGGDSSLRPELLALLPLPRRRLAWALLVVGLCDPALLVVALGCSAVVAVAAGLGIAAVLVAGVAALLLVVLIGVAATVAGGVLGPGDRRGRDAGTVAVAIAISIVAVSGTLLPSTLGALGDGQWPVLAAIARGLPSGWAANAVAGAYRSEWPVAVGWLLALLLATGSLVAAWPAVLTRRMAITPVPARGSQHRGAARSGRVTPTGAVVVKELRLWLRDPIRVTCLLIALIVGAGVALIPRVVSHTTVLMPFAGPLTVLIAGACACNLYGGDGTSLWLTVMTPDIARADVRGRQLAWLLLVAPATTVETALLTVWSGQGVLWPWAVGLLIALLGGAAGLVPLASLISVQPLDDAGNPTPAWSLKVHIALFAVLLTAGPTIGLLLLGAVNHSSAVCWLGVPVGVITGLACTVALAAAAARRLAAQQVTVLRTLVRAA